MRKTFLAALLLGAASTVLAQDAKPATGSPKIAVVDMARISEESELGKGFKAQLEKLKSDIDAQTVKMQGELQKMDAQIKTLQEELEKQSGVLSQDALERKRQDIVKKGRERDAYVEDGRGELQRLQQTAQGRAQALNGEFQAKLKPVIEQVAKAKGIDILLDSQVALTVNTSYDISADVIAKSNEMNKAAAAAPAAPATASAKPAAAATAPKPAASPTAKP